MHWRLTCVMSLRKMRHLPPADKTSLQPGAGNEERVPAAAQQGRWKQHKIISSLQFYPLYSGGFFLSTVWVSCVEKPRRLVPAHGYLGFQWAWSLPKVTISLTDHGVPIKCCLRCLVHMLLCRWGESICTQPCFQDAYRSGWAIKITSKINGL